MSTPSDYQENKYDHSGWVLIAQHLLREDSHDEVSGAKSIAGSLFQALRALGFAPEAFEKLEDAITGIIRTTRRQSHHGSKPELPVQIRLFCQRVLLDSLSNYEKQLLGGWGYYIIERGGDPLGAVCDQYHRIVEFYIYREGINTI
jgi:hypothetical protein